MNTNNMLYFEVLANELHFGKAAKKLHITQPPLSRAIRQLEEDLEVTLFERDSRNVTLTLAGEYLRQRISVISNNIHETEREIKMIEKGEKGYLHVTSVASILHIILPLINSFVQKHPFVRFKISHYTTLEQMQFVKSKEADIAFLRTPIHTDGLQLHEICKEYFVLVTPKKMDLKIQTKADLIQLSNFPYVSFPRHFAQGLHDQIISLCNTIGFSPNITHEAYQLNTIIRMVESGLGVSIVPESSLVGLEIDINVLKLDFMPQQSGISCYYDEKNKNHVLKKFLDESLGIKK